MDLNTQLEYKQKKRTSLHSEAIRANAEYNRYVESAWNLVTIPAGL